MLAAARSHINIGRVAHADHETGWTRTAALHYIVVSIDIKAERDAQRVPFVLFSTGRVHDADATN
jgi:hypothetical protein